MKFTIKTDVLKNITGALAKVTAKDSFSSVSNGMYIEVSGGKVLFTEQQIDFGVSYVSDAEKTEDGSVFVPVPVFESVVNSLVDGMVEVTLTGKKLVVVTGTSESEVYVLEEGEKPVIERPSGDPSFSIRREVLVQGFKDVQHAAAESVVKPEIASVYVYTKDKSIYFVSTDAFRLAEARFLSEHEADDVQVLIPIRNVMKLLRVLESISDADVALYMQEGSVYFVSGAVVVKTSNVTGSFPDYKSIIPSSFDITVTALKGDITNFLKKARLFADTLNKLSLVVEDSSTLSLALNNETVGVTRNTIPVVTEGSAGALPSFNYKFVHDALSVISDDRVVISATQDKTKPIMIRGTDDTAFTAVLSPLLDTQ